MRTDYKKIVTNSGGGSSDYKTVGTGGDYATIYDAITDGEKYLKIISNLSLTANITSDNINIYLSVGITLTIGAYRITGQNCRIIGLNGSYNRNSYNQGILNIIGGLTFGTLFTDLYVENITIDQTSYIGHTANVFDNSVFNECVFKVNNGANKYLFGNKCLINNSQIIGGGTTCYGIAKDSVIMNNIYFSGTFSVIQQSFGQDITLNEGYNNATNLAISGNISFVSGNAIKLVSGVYNKVNAFTNGYPNVGNMKVYDSEIELTVGLIFGSQAHDFEFYNCNLTGHPLRATSPTKYIIDRCIVDGSTNTSYLVDVDNFNIKNSIMTNNLYISGNNNSIESNKIMTGTITVNATADKTNISNCRTLTSIVDNGTNTILQNNQLI